MAGPEQVSHGGERQMTEEEREAARKARIVDGALESIKERERERDRAKAYRPPGEINVSQVYPEELEPIKRDLGNVLEGLEAYAPMARAEIQNHPESFARNTKVWFETQVKEKNGGVVEIAGQFYAANAEGKPIPISPYGISLERKPLESPSENEEREKKFWTDTVSRGIEKIADQLGIPRYP
jgi:hypothetical protein